MFLKFRIYKSIWEYIAPVIRTTTVFNSMKAFAKPIKTRQDELHKNVDELKSKLLHNGQKLMLEHRLNTQISLSGGSIYITQPTMLEELYVFTNDEEAPSNYLFTNSETGITETYIHTNYEFDNEYDTTFYVLMNKIDYDIPSTYNQVQGILNDYTPFGSSYSISWYIR